MKKLNEFTWDGKFRTFNENVARKDQADFNVKLTSNRNDNNQLEEHTYLSLHTGGSSRPIEIGEKLYEDSSYHWHIMK